ncbi:hypothetical protein FRC11_002582, partial [Ceratobasidium sp. 423]
TPAVIPLPEPFDVLAVQSGAGPAKDVEVSVGGVANSLMQYEDQVVNINDSDSDSVDPWDKYGASIKREAIPLPSLGAIRQTTEVPTTSLAQWSGSERLLTSALPLVQAGTTSKRAKSLESQRSGNAPADTFANALGLSVQTESGTGSSVGLTVPISDQTFANPQTSSTPRPGRSTTPWTPSAGTNPPQQSTSRSG